MAGSLRVGIDIGSTTIKLVVLDEHSSIVFQQYARHFSDITAALQSVVGKAHRVLKQKLMSVMLTGSAGIGLSQSLGLPFVQEVIAASTAIRNIMPFADTAIELGGEDAKITYFKGTVEQRMNGICAGGTGAFIDHMAGLLNTDPQGLNELAKGYKTIHPIASRCGVFAKTDVQALLNEGAAKADIAASILQAVVNQTIGGLAQGRSISGKVAMLGGPLHFLSELRRRFIETLHLAPDQVLTPDYAPYFVAIGAAMALQSEPVPYENLRRKAFPQLTDSRQDREEPLKPLFQDADELNAFSLRHQASRVARGDLATYAGDAFLGIDAGSTTTKLALTDSQGRLLYSHYGSNQGNPLDTVIAALKQLYAQLPDPVRIAGSAVTGYGEHYIRAALDVDSGEVETMAHLKAARHFAPSVTAVLDIGGQDMKSFCVKNSVIDSIVLNEACSSGCGSFIETFAHALGMNVAEFARLGLQAKQPVNLGTRCTVFMNSKVKQAQKEGASVSDISAGISVSIVKNALFKVIRLKNAAELGDTIVVQGGTFYNDSVLRATEQILGRSVIRPDIAGLMGAFGAALIARDRTVDGKNSSLITAAALDKFTAQSSSHRCKSCGNQCLISTQRFSNGKTFHSGNRCERGIGKVQATEPLPNLYAYKLQRLFQYEPLDETAARRGVVGLPRVLNMYEDYPFWFTFFSRLGYRVVLSAPSSRRLYEQGMDSIPSDSICYPAKLVHGHIADLLQRGVTKIFFPSIPYNRQEQSQADNCYNCPVVTSYPDTVKTNMDGLRNPAVTFYHPFLPLPHRAPLIDRLLQELAAERISRQELTAAVDAAYAELDRYKADVRQAGQAALAHLRLSGGVGVILAGRPYHLDPEINHGLPELIQAQGLVILSEDSVCQLGEVERPLRVVDQWVYHSRLYAAADYCASEPNLEFIQINSFGCGLDAVTIDQVKEILETKQKIYTAIKLDEISNLGAARIRLRSLLATRNERQVPPAIPRSQRPVRSARRAQPALLPGRTLLVPQLSPVHFQFLSAAFRQIGLQLAVPPLPDRQAIDEGLKYVNNDACYPAILAIGQLLQALQSGQYPLDRTSVMLSQTGGCCRASNYAAMARKALADAGFPEVPVLVFGQSNPANLRGHLSLLRNLIVGTLYGDLLMRLLYRVRPYEEQSGAAQALYDKWSAICCSDMATGGDKGFSENVRAMVREFDQLSICDRRKPRVGLVGEILVKYHPVANNRLIELLEAEGAEVVVPDLMDFFLYCAYDGKIEHDLLAGSLFAKWKGALFIQLAEFYRRPLRQALANSRRFAPPLTIDQLAGLAARHISLGNLAGEGWLLTAEMVELIESGATNIICMQPFACLPNHITGKGVLGELRRCYPDANIVPIDYDPGASEVNQLNRIKLMLAVAAENLPQPS
jgi:predicted CoA-substrate-specific enzyme activase